MKKNLFALLALTSVIMGCHRHEDTNNAQDHGHDHGEVKLMFTAYSDNYEIFAEADPFAAGSPSAILVHITTLSDFKPLTEGRITTSLITGNTGIRQSVDTPERPGIYLFSLRPESTGQGRLQVTISAQGKEETLEIGLVTIYADAHEAIHEEELLLKETPGAIVFTKEQSWRIAFATDIVLQKPFGPVIKTTGLVLPTLTDETTLHAGTRGMISFVGNRLYEGSQVRKGSHLITITGTALADDNATVRFREARNNYEKSKADYERISKLVGENILSERELLEAANTYRNAELLYENLRKNFSERGQYISSPHDGFVRDLLVSEGQFVETGHPIIRIAQNKEMRIKADVQQRYAGTLQQIQDITIGTGNNRVFTLSDIRGSVLTIGQAVNTQTNMIPVNLSLPGDAPVIPGTLVDVYLKASSDEPVIIVPNTALVEEQDNFFVFIQIHPESFFKQQVSIGHTDGIHTEVIAGLPAGERIVTHGAVMVKLAAAAGELDPHAGHVH